MTSKVFSYTIGFVFKRDLKTVKLIRKDTAHKESMKWQHGLLNAVGGTIELGETPEECMRRECLEEFGINVPTWQRLAHFVYTNGLSYNENGETEKAVVNLHAYRTVLSDDQYNSITQASREIPEDFEISETNNLDIKIVSNLRWMIPAALYEEDMGIIRMQLPCDQNSHFLSRYVEHAL
ncbi:hypothetical protein CL653_03325 [bacterium]|nr:hypothetical protein [bacterium]|tara:strand:+ start:1165 stop:1704 length:540 start_codon:yes stop_codon:yes gene_type:complete